MKFTQTEGVIIKKRTINDNDLVVTVLSKNLGKIDIWAKGAKKINSKRGGKINEISQCNIAIYTGGKNMHINDIRTIDSFKAIKNNFSKVQKAYLVLELTDKLIQESEKDHRIYELIIQILSILDKSLMNDEVAIMAFIVKLMDYVGLAPNLDTINMSDDSKKIFRFLQKSTWKDVGRLKISDKLIKKSLNEVLEISSNTLNIEIKTAKLLY